MTWTEGVLHISDNLQIHGGYLGIISFLGLVFVSILYTIFAGAVGAMIDDTIKELNKKQYGNEN